MKDKLHTAMSKFCSTTISVPNTYVFFNMCLITQVCFGCGIIILTLKEEEMLMKISKLMLLGKLGLSDRFLRKILHTRKSELRVGIIKLSTAIAIFLLKSYFSHKRKEDRISNTIAINKRNTSFQYGRNKYIITISRSNKPKKVI